MMHDAEGRRASGGTSCWLVLFFSCILLSVVVVPAVAVVVRSSIAGPVTSGIIVIHSRTVWEWTDSEL